MNDNSFTTLQMSYKRTDSRQAQIMQPVDRK